MNVLFMRNLFKVTIIALFSMCASAQVAPSASIVTSTTLFCTNVPITYSAQTTGTDLSYTWAVVPSKGLTSFTDLHSPTVTLTFTGTITYTIYLNVSDASGITSIKQTTVTPNRSAHASFNASLNSVGFPSELTLTNYSTYSLKNYWEFNNDSKQRDTSFSLQKEFSSGGSYKVFLFAYGVKGCNDSARYDFWISDSSGVTLPNVFTPNNDGANDVFIPITRGISDLRAWVYNRYGVLVCAWDKPKGGWDGHSTSGEECSDGVYFVAVDAFGFDGKIYKLKGTVTLIR